VLGSSRNVALPRRVVIAAGACLAVLISGCEAGTNAPSLQWHQPTDGTAAQVGAISISDAFVLGAPLGKVLEPGQNAGLFLGLANTGPADRLVGVSAPGTAQSVALPGGSLAIGRQPILLTGPQPELILEHLTRPLAGGSILTVVLTFQNAGSVRIRVPVMPRAQYYSTFSPAPSPAPSGTPAGAWRKHHKPRSPATPAPSPTGS